MVANEAFVVAVVLIEGLQVNLVDNEVSNEVVVVVVFKVVLEEVLVVKMVDNKVFLVQRWSPLCWWLVYTYICGMFNNFLGNILKIDENTII